MSGFGFNDSLPGNVTISLKDSLFTELIICFTLKLVINFIGGLTNLMLILVCFYSDSQSSGTKWLVIQYTASYFIISILLYPIRDIMILGFMLGIPVPGSQYCPHFAAINTFFSSLANWTDLALAINRLAAIYFFERDILWRTRKSVIFLLVAAWLVSFLIVIPPIYGGWQTSVDSATSDQCSNLRRGAAAQFVTVMTNFVPLGLAGLLYGIIVMKLIHDAQQRSTSISLGTSGGPGPVRLLRAKMRQITIARMLIAIFLWNLLCMLPYFVVTLDFPLLFVENHTLALWMRFIISVQYLVNPLIFLAYSAEYRRTGLALLHCITRCTCSKSPRDLSCKSHGPSGPLSAVHSVHRTHSQTPAVVQKYNDFL